VLLILDFLNSKPVAFYRFLRILLWQASSHSDQEFLFYCVNIHTHAHHDKVIVISVLPHYDVSVDDDLVKLSQP